MIWRWEKYYVRKSLFLPEHSLFLPEQCIRGVCCFIAMTELQGLLSQNSIKNSHGFS